MTTEKINTLKQEMVTNKSFEKVFAYFLDHFGDKKEFHEIGEDFSPDKATQNMLAQALRSVLEIKKDWVQLEGFFYKIDRFDMIHGSFKCGGVVGSFFFFHDTGIGLLSAFSPSGGFKGVKFARFTRTNIPLRGKDGFAESFEINLN